MLGRQGSLDAGDQPFGVIGLLDEVNGAFVHRCHGHGDVAVAGDQDDGSSLPLRLQHALQIEARTCPGRRTSLTMHADCICPSLQEMPRPT